MVLTQEQIGNRLKEARKSAQLSQEAAAHALGLDRTAMVKIEKGTRTVSSVELYKLARLFRRDPGDFLAEESLQDDPFTTFGRIYENAQLEWSDQIGHNLEILKEGVRLRELLSDYPVTPPPFYYRHVPRSYEQAVEQGKEIAILERERLNLGSAPIPDIASLIASQGIWTAAVEFPDTVSGLFIAHDKYGLAVFINQAHARVRRRFSYAHEYAHALIDRDRKVAEPTSQDNRNDYTEKRANAFASEFLVPSTGVYEMLDRMHKGNIRSASSWIWDAATDEAVHHDVRGGKSTHKISPHDVALIADEYVVSYDAAAIRLKDINAVKYRELENLRAQRKEGMQFLQTLEMFDDRPHDPPKEQPYLIRQLIILAIEAFQQDKISTGRLRSICDLTGVPFDKIMPVAMAGQE